MYLVTIILLTTIFASVLTYKKKVVSIPLMGFGLLCLCAYVYAGNSANRTMSHLASKTTRATIEVQGLVDNKICTTESVELTSQDDLSSLFSALKLGLKPVFKITYCACRGNPHIQLYNKDTPLAGITIHHGKSIRCDLWSGNVDIRRSKRPRLKSFLASKGVELSE